MHPSKMSKLRLVINSVKRRTSSKLRRVTSALFDGLYLSVIVEIWSKIVYTFKSLTYNDYLDVSYSCDTLMEPMFWFVDNFTSSLGPVSFHFG